MCIAWLSKTITRIDQVEQIWLKVSGDGAIRAEEVYDIFFKTPRVRANDPLLKSVTALILHRHRVHDHRHNLSIDVPHTMGTDSPYDAIYWLGCGFDIERQVVTGELAATSQQNYPETSPYSGKVLTPTVRLPERVRNHKHAFNLLTRERGIGSMFELALGDLQPDKEYA